MIAERQRIYSAVSMLTVRVANHIRIFALPSKTIHTRLPSDVLLWFDNLCSTYNAWEGICGVVFLFEKKVVYCFALLLLARLAGHTREGEEGYYQDYPWHSGARTVNNLGMPFALQTQAHPGALSLLVHALVEAVNADFQALFFGHELQCAAAGKSQTDNQDT